MASIIRCYISTLSNFYLSITKLKQNPLNSHSISTLASISHSISKPTNKNCIFSHHLAGLDPIHAIVNSICESLKKGLNWDALSRQYDTSKLSDSVIEKVLLEFKEPSEAKRALGFFHWVAHNKKTSHGVKLYCMIAHILARARLVNDARGLLESVLMRVDGDKVDDSLRFKVVDGLLGTYRISDSCPLVFNLLVQSYCKLRMFETAFDVACYLNEQGFSLSLGTYNALLYGVQKSDERISLIWEVYGHMIENKIYPNKMTMRIMINALCKAGELQKYVDIVNRIHGRRCPPIVIVNTSLVYRMLGEGRIDEGLLLLKTMLQKDIILDTISYSLIVCAKLKSGELESARAIYEEMLCNGFFPNAFVYTLFIEAYIKEGMVEKALRLMDELTNKGLSPYDDTYNFLIIGCAKSGNLINSIRFCEEMTEKGLLTSCSAFNEMVGRLCEGGSVRKANEMLTVLLEKGFLPDETTYFYLIDGYRREKKISEMLKLYYEMEFRSLLPGLLIFSSLIRTMCEHKKLEEADKYFAIMKSRLLCPSVDIYESLMVAHLENGNKGRAKELYNEMHKKG